MTTLLTGFPGFLGTALAERLLATRAARIVALVPPQHRALAEARALDLEVRLGRRVEIVTGDLGAEGLGLPADVPWLRDVTHVVHLAAVYDLAVGDDLAWRVNVDGTQRVVDLCGRMPALRRLVHVSTCYVSGRVDGIFGEDDLGGVDGRPLPVFANAYERTKHEAERRVRAAMAGGLPATVVRPAIVVGDAATGATAKYDGPYGVVRWLLRWPAPVPVPVPLFGRSAETLVNLVPRDTVVAALDALALDPAAEGQTVALADPAPLTVEALVAVLARACGRRVLPVRLPASAVGVVARIPGLERLTGIAPASLPYFTHPTRYATTNARRLLAPHGIAVPPFESYADRLVAFVRANPTLPTKGLA